MEFFFNPKSIALIGATANPSKGGYNILKNLNWSRVPRIFPVNPKYDQIENQVCYPSILDIQEPVDLAIIFVPAEQTPPLVEQCARQGIKGVIVESGGFAETGSKGLKLQNELSRLAQQTGIRIWGPNCMGLVDISRQLIFSFVTSKLRDEILKSGNISLIVQSGMLSASFLIDTMSHGTGLSKVCSIGNKVDVEECELVSQLMEDAQTKVIGLYLESIKQGRKFAQICSQSSKPVVLLKGGKSPKGSEAAISHTGSLGGDYTLLQCVLRQSGVILANDFLQMVDICRTLCTHPQGLPGKGKLAVITYSGAAGILSADFMHEHGLQMAVFSEKTRSSLQQVYPPWMPVANPVDLWPGIELNGPQVIPTALKAICADPEVEAILIHLFAGSEALQPEVSSLMQTAQKYQKPIFCWIQGPRQEAFEYAMQAQEHGMLVFRELYRAVECIKAGFDYSRRKAMITDAV